MVYLIVAYRPYRVWITTPIIFCFVSLFLITMPFVMVPLESLAALGFIVAGVPLWYMQAKFNEIWSTKGKGCFDSINCFSIIMY